MLDDLVYILLIKLLVSFSVVACFHRIKHNFKQHFSMCQENSVIYCKQSADFKDDVVNMFTDWKYYIQWSFTEKHGFREIILKENS